AIDTGFQLGALPQLGFKFYGRRKEYRQLRDALLVNNHRAVIIHGIGGIGKTSLIAHAADRLYHRRPRFKGVYAFDCAGATLAPERALLELHRYFALQGVDALERFIGQPLEPETLAQIVAQLLGQWPLLLIFDNFETQLARAEQGFRIADEALRRFLAALVKATATNTKFVFTCRFLFELDERLGDVASLPLGDLSRPEAFSVMLKLPRLARASYEEKVTIYDTFGGHPFALVALDKYCQTVPIDKALQNAKAVHTKLREHLALELNYGRLTERARELLNRLAAFRATVPMEAAEWVMGETVTPSPEALQSVIARIRQDENASVELKDVDDATLLQMLAAALPVQRQAPDDLQAWVRELIEWGLLTPVYESDKLSLLDVHSLVRDFCREKQPGAWRDSLREAAGFYTNQTRQIPENQKTPAMVWSEMEAFELLMEAEDYRDAARLLLGAHVLLDRWGFGRYVESQYARVLDQVERDDAARLMHNLGVLQQGRGNYEEALDYYQRSLKIAEEIGDVESVAGSLHQIGWVQQERGNYEAALDYYQRSLKIKEEIGDVAGVASSLHNIGMVQQDRGNYEEALDYYRRSLKILEEIGDVAGVASSLHQIGMVQQDRGNYEAALGYYQRSLNIKEEIGVVAGVARSQGQIGQLLAETGRYVEAFGLLMNALGAFIQLQSPNAGIAANDLKTLRGEWDGFDAAWREATGGDVPEWLQ
ncbi:MAG: tetratricopeptide repeat protein, partial [Blastocatellia bacterium]